MVSTARPRDTQHTHDITWPACIRGEHVLTDEHTGSDIK